MFKVHLEQQLSSRRSGRAHHPVPRARWLAFAGGVLSLVVVIGSVPALAQDDLVVFIDGNECPQSEPHPLAGQFCASNDGGKFDHEGRCYRQLTAANGSVGGSQCCYDWSTGQLNPTGSYDVIACANAALPPSGSCLYSISCIPFHCIADVQPYCCQQGNSTHPTARNEAAYDSCMDPGAGIHCGHVPDSIYPGLDWEDCPAPPEQPVLEPDPPGGSGGDPGSDPNYDDDGSHSCWQCWGERAGDLSDTYYGSVCGSYGDAFWECAGRVSG